MQCLLAQAITARKIRRLVRSREIHRLDAVFALLQYV